MARWRLAFTLVEVMVSIVVLAVMLLIISQIITQAQRSWRTASARLSQFREARIAFDTITRNLRQATLTTYRDFYYGSDPNDRTPDSLAQAPTGSVRTSNLAFRCGDAASLVGGLGSIGEPVGHAIFFEAPLGVTANPDYESLKNLLCVRGYFLVLGSDEAFLPAGLAGQLTPSTRLRLMEFQPPAELNRIYEKDSTSHRQKILTDPDYWIDFGSGSGGLNPVNYLRPISENIAALIISPRWTAGNNSVTFAGSTVAPTDIAPQFEYDSLKDTDPNAQQQGTQHLLPPVIQVTMIALDSASVSGPNASSALDVLSGVSSFNDAQNLDNDLRQLETRLNAAKVNYRIFESSVVIPASKYSL